MSDTYTHPSEEELLQLADGEQQKNNNTALQIAHRLTVRIPAPRVRRHAGSFRIFRMSLVCSGLISAMRQRSPQETLNKSAVKGI